MAYAAALPAGLVAVTGAATLYTTRQPKVFAAQISIIIDPKEPRFIKTVRGYGYQLVTPGR